jgi:hypothetical protein
VLRCDECKATADTFELGWASFYVQLEDDPEPMLMTLCGRCAHREAGSTLKWLAEGAPTIDDT